MRKLGLFTFCLFLSLPVLSGETNKRPPTAYEFLSLIDKKTADTLKPDVRVVPLTRLYIKGNVISFRFLGIRMHFTATGTLEEVVKFNGRSFSIKDFRDKEALELAYRSKFGITNKKREFSIMNLLKGRGSAALDGTSPIPTSSALAAAKAYEAALADQKEGATIKFDGLNTTKFETFNQPEPPVTDIMAGSLYQKQLEAGKLAAQRGTFMGAEMAVAMLGGMNAAMTTMGPMYDVIFHKGDSLTGPAVRDYMAPHQKKRLNKERRRRGLGPI